MGLFTNKGAQIKELEAKIEDLKYEINSLTTQVTYHQEVTADSQISLERQQTDHKISLARTKHEYMVQIADLEREIDVLNDNKETDIEDGIIDAKVRLAKKTEELERLFAQKTKNLMAEYADKIGKCDKRLEDDKASYRKYLRTEYNSKIEALEKENKKLTQEVAELTGENIGLTSSVDFLSGQVETMAECMKGLTAALPQISASFTTPEINLNLPKANENKGGEQKKN